MKIELTKQTPKDMAAVGRNIYEIGGRYIAYSGDLARYQSNTRGLNIEFNINSLEEQKDFKCSLPVDPMTNKQLGDLSKGSGQVTFTHEVTQCRFTNGSRNVIIKCSAPNLTLQTIDDQISNFVKIEGPEEDPIQTLGELSLTGREKNVLLVVRDDTFTGIILNGSGEHYFDPKASDELKDHHRLLLRSNYFLKIGREKFKVQLLRKDQQYWLLTEVDPGLGIKCRMLETLTIL